MLNLNSETLRKYALTLEKEGFLFSKTQGGQRQYYEKDVIVFNHFISLLNQTGMKIPIAAKAVVTRHSSTSQTVTTDITVAETGLTERSEERYTEMMSIMQTNQILLDSLLKERQEDKAEIQALKESLSQIQTDVKDIRTNLPTFDIADLGKQLLQMQQEAAAELEERRKEEKATEQVEMKKGFFSRFWKKKA